MYTDYLEILLYCLILCVFVGIRFWKNGKKTRTKSAESTVVCNDPNDPDTLLDIGKLKALVQAKQVIEQERMPYAEVNARDLLKRYVICDIWNAARAGKLQYEIRDFILTPGHGLNIDYAEAITIAPKELSRMPKILTTGCKAWYLAQWCEKQNLQWEFGIKNFESGYREWTFVITWRD
jgi:hypothetical protein